MPVEILHPCGVQDDMKKDSQSAGTNRPTPSPQQGEGGDEGENCIANSILISYRKIMKTLDRIT